MSDSVVRDFDNCTVEVKVYVTGRDKRKAGCCKRSRGASRCCVIGCLDVDSAGTDSDIRERQITDS